MADFIGKIWALLKGLFLGVFDFFRHVGHWIAEHRILIFISLFGSWGALFLGVRALLPRLASSLLNLMEWAIPDLSDSGLRAGISLADKILDFQPAINCISVIVAASAWAFTVKLAISKMRFISRLMGVSRGG